MQTKQFRQTRAYPGARLRETLALEAGTRSRRSFQQLMMPGEVSNVVLYQPHSISRKRCKHMPTCTSRRVVLKVQAVHIMRHLWRRMDI